MDNLFDIYVRDMEQWFAGNEDMLSRLYSKADRINKIVQKSGLNQDKKDDSEYVVVSIANLFAEFSEKYSDLRDMRVKSEVTETALRERIKSLELENERLKRVKNNESITEITNVLGIPDMKELSENIEKVLGLFEDNVKVMALREAMRTTEYKERDRSGEKSPRFIQGIDNDELVKLYTQAGYTLTKDIVNYYKKKYGVTYNGLMERLKTLNVWQYKNKK